MKKYTEPTLLGLIIRLSIAGAAIIWFVKAMLIG